MNTNKPIYLQIAEGLEDDVQAGRYPSDSRLPSVRDTAATSQVNVNTAMRAYEHLEREGIIYNRRGIGYFVCADAKERILTARKEQFFAGEMRYFFARLSQIGISTDELSRLYSSYLENDNA